MSSTFQVPMMTSSKIERKSHRINPYPRAHLMNFGMPAHLIDFPNFTLDCTLVIKASAVDTIFMTAAL